MTGRVALRAPVAAIAALALASAVAPGAVRAADAPTPPGSSAAEPRDAATLDRRFDEAARAFWAGDIRGAYDGWQALDAYDVGSPELLYNLGAAAYQLGRAGEARAWFERARRIDPHDGDLRANIAAVEQSLAAGDVVRVVRPGAAAGEGSFEWWYLLFTRVTPGQAAIAFLFLHALFFGVLVARRFMAAGAARTLLLWGNVPLVLSVVATGVLLGGAAYVAEAVDVSVAVGRATVVREGPADEAQPLFELPEGRLLLVTERQPGWRRVRLNDHLQGWVEQAHLMDVR